MHVYASTLIWTISQSKFNQGSHSHIKNIIKKNLLNLFSWIENYMRNPKHGHSRTLVEWLLNQLNRKLNEKSHPQKTKENKFWSHWRTNSKKKQDIENRDTTNVFVLNGTAYLISAIKKTCEDQPLNLLNWLFGME